MIKDAFSLKLISSHLVTPTVRHLVFATVDDEPMTFIPGQFITFHFEAGGAMQQRSYSIATIPGHTHHIEIAVSPFPGGLGTEYLFALKEGDEVQTTGPFGRLILRDEHPGRYILIATGTGVTPYRSMLPDLLKRIEEQDIRVVVLLGVQHRHDLLYGEDFLSFTQKHPNLEFHAYYSREALEDKKPHEHKGYVQTAFEGLNLDPVKDVVYLCGNPNMIDEAFNMLREMGFQSNQVRREKYISPKQR